MKRLFALLSLASAFVLGTASGELLAQSQPRMTLPPPSNAPDSEKINYLMAVVSQLQQQTTVLNGQVQRLNTHTHAYDPTAGWGKLQFSGFFDVNHQDVVQSGYRQVLVPFLLPQNSVRLQRTGGPVFSP